MPHSGDGRAQNRTGATQHGSSLTRLSSLAVAVVLAAMALTTGGDGLASRPSTSARYVAAPAAPPATPAAAPSPPAVPAVEASAKVATVVQAAGEALSDSQYVTTEAPVDTAARDRIKKATSALRTLVREASTEPVAPERTRTAQGIDERSHGPAATSPTAAASGTGATPAATVEPVEVRASDPDPDPVVGRTVPDEAGDAPDHVLATATTTPEETDPASDSVHTADEAAVAIKKATARLRTVLDATPAAAVSVKPAPPTPEEIAARRAAAAAKAAAAEAERAAKAAAAEAERVAQLVAATAGYGNGLIPLELLCEVSFSPGQRLRCDAAAQLEQLNAAYAAQFGRNLGVSDSYRSYAAQVTTKALKKNLAATPGTSNHGWGLAVDLSGGIQSFGTTEFNWMTANAGAYGWEHPSWAEPGGSKPEPWHWEYGTQD
ncbi:D-alanyl-D-alanine carboxypeptidase family protein [Promicromonospora sp. NPDC057138]|uniref:M15 family metallopeptidase n=1 Tax=Promicromonospora sp. NPDC057138 TaxID=3346031 RepID=UPI0036443A16